MQFSILCGSFKINRLKTSFRDNGVKAYVTTMHRMILLFSTLLPKFHMLTK